jgi:hypothetical protein
MDPSESSQPPAITWEQRRTGEESLKLCHAVLETSARPVFASIEECHEPPGMWLLTMFPRGPRSQFAIYFDGLEKAMRSVELWARHYWHSIEGAAAEDQPPG